NSALAVHPAAPFCLAVVVQAFKEVVRRHGALRTALKEVDGEPVQVVVDMLTLPFRVIDVADLPEPAREAEAQRIATEEARRAFDLSADQLVRAAVLRLSVDHHILVLTMHHIIYEAWSMSIFAHPMPDL